MNGSPSAIAGISTGKPPACQTPRFTSSARVAEMLVARVHLAPGIEDGDDRLAGIILGGEAHLLGARAMAERAQIGGAVPARTAQLGVRFATRRRHQALPNHAFAAVKRPAPRVSNGRRAGAWGIEVHSAPVSCRIVRPSAAVAPRCPPRLPLRPPPLWRGSVPSRSFGARASPGRSPIRCRRWRSAGRSMISPAARSTWDWSGWCSSSRWWCWRSSSATSPIATTAAPWCAPANWPKPWRRRRWRQEAPAAGSASL